MLGFFSVPNSVKAITPLVGRILVESENLREKNALSELYLFFNRPRPDVVYTPASQRLLPLDETWRRDLADFAWPTSQLPEVLGGGTQTLRALIRDSRLAAMQRAEKKY